jgi:hypothetical protein
MESTPENTQKPKTTFGKISLALLPVAAGLVVYFPLTIPAGLTGERAGGYALQGLYYGSFLCILNVLIAFVGIATHERPRWPAITGLALSFLPALGGIYLLCGAPW